MVPVAQHESTVRELCQTARFDSLVGNSPNFLELLHAASQVAETDATVLLEGESGTGKELVARAIHANSCRRARALVIVNCGAFPEHLLESEFFGYEKGAFTGATKRYRGKFELADRGTIFLDEVDEMSKALQVKLLRVIQWGDFTPLGSEQSRRCDVRIIAATKRGLAELVEERRFRDDLYYRLNVVAIEIPPLRERREDILPLARHFLKKACRKYNKPVLTLNPKVKAALKNYCYPGNIRQLENAIDRAVIFCRGEIIGIEHLPKEFLPPGELSDSRNDLMCLPFQEAKRKVVETFERRYLQNKLEVAGGIIKKAAELAGMHEKNFHSKLIRLRLKPQAKSSNPHKAGVQI